MTGSASTTERFHALDALRAAMMFLGIYLHAVVAYSPSGGWPWRQTELTRTLDWSLSLIHLLRMPIFYAMPGFFTPLPPARYAFLPPPPHPSLPTSRPFPASRLSPSPL